MIGNPVVHIEMFVSSEGFDIVIVTRERGARRYIYDCSEGMVTGFLRALDSGYVNMFVGTDESLFYDEEIGISWSKNNAVLDSPAPFKFVREIANLRARFRYSREKCEQAKDEVLESLLAFRYNHGGFDDE